MPPDPADHGSTAPRASGRGEASTSPPVASLRHPLTRALLGLTVTTGLVDAACYLGIGHVFAANMTGNIVLLGFGIAGAGGLPVLAPVISLIAFLSGVAAAGRLVVFRAQEQQAQFITALVIEVVLVAAAAVVAIAVHVRPSTVAGDTVIALLAFAMGVRNATSRKLAVPDLTTTVLTMTLVGFASESRPAGGEGRGNVRRASAVVAMLTGAVIGGLLLKSSLALVLVAAFALTAGTLIAYTAGRPRP